MLLDVTNLYINSRNLGFDWRQYLDNLPLERVVQLHFVGFRSAGGRLVDAHADPTDGDVWELFREVVSRCDVKGAILERDENFPDFIEIADEIFKARGIFADGRTKRNAAASS